MIICSIDGCERPSYVRGWCQRHYNSWYKFGVADRPMRVVGDDSARFWSHVNKTETCWLWTGPLNPATGYAQIRMGGRGGTYELVHRWAYREAKGPIPKGRHLDHLCRVRHCVNPDHLEPVTARENVLRGVGPSARNQTKTHCKRDHEFTPENTYVTKKGTRSCRTCAVEHTRQWRMDQKLSAGDVGEVILDKVLGAPNRPGDRVDADE